MAEATRFSGDYRRFCKEPHPEVALGELAERQHGVVALRQLGSLGLSDSAVRRRTGRLLHRVHRGVYAVGSRRLSASGRRMAAVLACGPEAVLSHRDAAAHYGLRPDNRKVVEVTVPRRSARARPGIDAHVSRTLGPEDVACVDGIPCMSVARTLLDLGDVVGPRDVE